MDLSKTLWGNYFKSFGMVQLRFLGLCLSFDLAYLLASRCSCPSSERHGQGCLCDIMYFHGTEALKGVFNEKPYPLFYLSCSDSVELALNDITKNGPVVANHVFKLFNETVKAWGAQIFMVKPYVVRDGQLVHGEIGTEHQERIRAYMEKLKSNYEEGKAPGGRQNMENDSKQAVALECIVQDLGRAGKLETVVSGSLDAKNVSIKSQL